MLLLVAMLLLPLVAGCCWLLCLHYTHTHNRAFSARLANCLFRDAEGGIPVARQRVLRELTFLLGVLVPGRGWSDVNAGKHITARAGNAGFRFDRWKSFGKITDNEKQSEER
uniref:Putative secreted protein n=1 Tax=Anopheles darlingi TaxID=43151 RepID=A0A2M4D5I1_ANODA